MPVVKNKVLFLTLRVFSATGGIERVCRIVGKALYELGLQYGGRTRVHAMYGKKDKAAANQYFPSLLVSDFGGNKVHYVINSILHGFHSEIVVLSHVNLLLVGFLIKLYRPTAKLAMLAHGIEVWKQFPAWKRYMLRRVDVFLPVSHYTSERMCSLNALAPERFRVINNCLDPFLEKPLRQGKSEKLLERYGFTNANSILLTVARMAATEHYKGYDKVIAVLPELVKEYPQLRYLLVGKYDDAEKKRLDDLISRLSLEENVVFAGMVSDAELADHFCLSDIFVMPSEKEGFGIVFIEAMFYGKPVIGGNTDGSVDALCHGEMGLLVNPARSEELLTALKIMLANPGQFRPDPDKLDARFSYKAYKKQMGQALGYGCQSEPIQV